MTRKRTEKNAMAREPMEGRPQAVILHRLLPLIFPLPALLVLLLLHPAGAQERKNPPGKELHLACSPAGETLLSCGIKAHAGEILARSSLEKARLFFSGEGISFLLGDRDGDGIEDSLTDIDALHIANPGPGTPRGRLLLSTSRNELGFRDGDVILLGGKGRTRVFLPESWFLAECRIEDGDVDVDAFTLSPSGHRYFSFADDEESPLAEGPGEKGVIEDGAVLCVDPGGGATVLYSEEIVTAMVAHALDRPVGDLDVTSLAYDGVSCRLLFTVDTPPGEDATVFTDSGGGDLLPGFGEGAFGFGRNEGLDAISLLPVSFDMPALEAEPRRPAAGEKVLFRVSGGAPGEMFRLLLSGKKASRRRPPYFGGFGVLALERRDPLFLSALRHGRILSGRFGPGGMGTLRLPVPVGFDGRDIAAQCLVAGAFALSHPVTVEAGQSLPPKGRKGSIPSSP